MSDRGLVNRLGIRLHRAVYQLTAGRVGRRASDGGRILLLTTRGRKSGQPRTVPLRYVLEGGSYVVVASNRGGQVPEWYHNLAAYAEVTLQVGGQRVPAAARTLVGEQRTVVWTRVVAANPRSARYQAAAERELPVVVLDPLPAGGRRQRGQLD